MKPGPLDLKDLDSNFVCVVQLKSQPLGVIHQVTLRPDKVQRNGRRSTDAYIRLGETPNDEANGWVPVQSITVITVLGTAKEVDGKWQASPYKQLTMDGVPVSHREAYEMVQ